jgi:thiamine-monophosphate kinase
MPTEFELIAQYFKVPARRRDVLLGIGDDAAVLEVPPGSSLVATTDTLVAGVHFPSQTSPEDLGHKALAVSLSDLAAAGAEPAWVTLALTLPEVNEAWLAAFSTGLGRLLESSGAELVGGDTTRGPLSVTLQALGLVPEGRELRRSTAVVGDSVFVTGCLGDAALGLAALQGRVALSEPALAYCVGRLNRPSPRIEAGIALRGVAHALIDISDGLLADLEHILTASGVGADLRLEEVPLSVPVKTWLEAGGDWDTVLAGGDDYELLFTAPESVRPALEAAFRRIDCPLRHIGRIEAEPGLRLWRPDGAEHRAGRTGYDHFAEA